MGGGKELGSARRRARSRRLAATDRDRGRPRRRPDPDCEPAAAAPAGDLPGGQPEEVAPCTVTRRPGQVACAWCGDRIEVSPVGRIPTWCSSSCRHRAWEQRRAADSGLVAREPFERIVEVEVEKPVRVEVEVPTIVVKRVEVMPVGRAWAPALEELNRQLERGVVYDRDLPVLVRALDDVIDAVNRRPWWRAQPGRR